LPVPGKPAMAINMGLVLRRDSHGLYLRLRSVAASTSTEAAEQHESSNGENEAHHLGAAMTDQRQGPGHS
jgi:hypothetical protein